MISTAQITAQLDAVLARDAGAPAIAIRAPSKADWPNTLTRRGRTFDIRWCESRLALREALDGIDTAASDDVAARGLVALTPLNDSEIPDDVAARLARGRVFQLRGWDTVRQLFGAQGTDARLGRYDWMPQELIELGANDGFAPVASGFLDLETAWREVLRGCLGLADARPDAVTLMRWAAKPDAAACLSRLSDKAQADTLEWLSTNGGLAAAWVTRCIRVGRSVDAAPLGLVCDVLFSPAAEGNPQLAQAAVRLERYVADHHVGVAEGRTWAAEARRLADLMPIEDALGLLDRADALLRELKVAEHAWLSDWLPTGLDQRIQRLAEAIDAYLDSPSDGCAAEVEDAVQASLAHRLAAVQELRADRLRMARRLVRWLHRPTAELQGLTVLASIHADEAAFVDWARFRLLGGDENTNLSASFSRLRQAALNRREQANRAFAASLAAQMREAGPPTGRLVPVEQVLQRVVAPLARAHPVLLLVVDGLSVAIFRELFDRPERHGWSEWVGDADGRPLVGLAAIPTVTETSRASLLTGRLTLGAAPMEKQGFGAHPALAEVSSASHPPALFHKGDLNDGGNLASAVRTALANPSQRVVGVVYNAIDDHLSGPDQLHQRWSLDNLRLLHPLLKEARDARRLVVVTADHGHVLDDDSSALEGADSDRWRAGHAAVAPTELALSGSRVLPPGGGTSVICLWSERARYAGRKNGYHGGVAPAEAIVPLSVFAPLGVTVSGWRQAPPQQPDWWDTPNSVLPPAQRAAAPARPAQRKPAAPPAGQGGLFADVDLPPVAAPTTDWIGDLLASKVYASQRQLAARVALPDEQMRVLLLALESRGGKLGRAALAQRLGVPEVRLSGLLSAARRLLNVDQAPVLGVDEPSGTVELNRGLLEQQFRLAAHAVLAGGKQ